MDLARIIHEAPTAAPKADYTGPNLILVRFGGGVRRRETIDPTHTYSPYFLHELVPRGTLFPAMEIAQLDGVETSHGQGTLYLLSGRYDRYSDVRGHPLGERPRQPPEIASFWDGWQRLYGGSGRRQPRGDRLLTELALGALHELRPKLMMINYNDPDYVHWGNPHHYTRGIGIIDRGLRRLVEAVEADAEYRDRTLFVVVPDCGRDDNRALRVPFQHHFASRAAHQIFALVFGPGIAAGGRVDRVVGQIDLAATIGALMGFATPHCEGSVLEEVFA